MKSALSAGIVAALLCPSAVVAGSSCPKTSSGSNRITCFVDVDHNEVKEEGHHHGHHGHHHKRGHKDKIETTRTISTYAWSFFWNWTVTDSCPKTTAQLSTVLPFLTTAHHGVKCTVEHGWTPEDDCCEDSCGISQSPKNQTLEEYAGHGHVDWSTLPARVHWPLFAGYGRPEHLSKSGELNIQYEAAGDIIDNTLEIHSGEGNDFFHCWGPDDHYGTGQYQKVEDHSDHGKKKKGHHKNKVESHTFLTKDHRKFGGFYNTDSLHSCWVFEKFHHGVRQVTETKKKHHGKHGHHGHHEEIETIPVLPFLPPTWSSCEPHFVAPHEEKHSDESHHSHDDGHHDDGHDEGDHDHGDEHHGDDHDDEGHHGEHGHDDEKDEGHGESDKDGEDCDC